MILKLYSVRDKLIGFGGPIAMKDEEVAKRWFAAYCQQKKENEYTESKYYELYEIGSFDSDKGVVEGYTKSELKLIVEGEQLDEQKN